MKIQRRGGLAECLASGPRHSLGPVCWQEEERMSWEKEGGLAKHVFKARHCVLGEGGRRFAGWSEEQQDFTDFWEYVGSWLPGCHANAVLVSKA